MKTFKIPEVKLELEDLYVTFYDAKDKIVVFHEPRDWDFYERPNFKIKNPYSELFDTIYQRMKIIDGIYANQIKDEKSRKQYQSAINRMQTPKSKKDFLLNFVAVNLSYEKLRNQIEKFIQKTFNDNPKFIKCRIHYSNKKIDLLEAEFYAQFACK